VKQSRGSAGLPQGRAYGDNHHAPGWAGWNTFTHLVVALAAGAAIFYFLLKIFARIDVVNSGHYDAIAYLLGTIGLAALSVGRFAAHALDARKVKPTWGHTQELFNGSELQAEGEVTGEKPRARPRRKRKFRRQL
jgi:hypothetical protein